MESKKIILVDSDILIKVFRGNKILKTNLDDLENRIVISAVTAFELYVGANSEKRIIETNKQLKAYQIAHITETISIRALSLFKEYKSKHTLLVADTLIAATALTLDIELFTDNKKDYDFIKGIKFYKP